MFNQYTIDQIQCTWHAICKSLFCTCEMMVVVSLVQNVRISSRIVFAEFSSMRFTMCFAYLDKFGAPSSAFQCELTMWNVPDAGSIVLTHIRIDHSSITFSLVQANHSESLLISHFTGSKRWPWPSQFSYNIASCFLFAMISVHSTMELVRFAVFAWHWIKQSCILGSDQYCSQNSISNLQKQKQQPKHPTNDEDSRSCCSRSG